MVTTGKFLLRWVGTSSELGNNRKVETKSMKVIDIMRSPRFDSSPAHID